MNITQNMTLDLTKRAAFQYVNAKQGDNGSRFVKIKLTDGGVNYRPPAGTAATFRAQKPDGTMVLNQAVVNDDGTVTVELTQQTLAVSGDVAADVCLTDNHGTQLSSVSFIIHVENAPTGEPIDSTNEFLKLLEIIERAELVTGDFESALDQLDSMKNEAVKASTSAGQSALDAKNAADNVHLTVSSELEKAKASGQFDGPKGDPGDGFTATDDGYGNLTIMSVTDVVYPPMLLGVEYRTPEYWLGKPVYSKLIDYTGHIRVGDNKMAHNISNVDYMLRCLASTTYGQSIPQQDSMLQLSLYADRTNVYVSAHAGITDIPITFKAIQLWYTKREVE